MDVVDVLGVEQGDRELAAVFGEVAVVAVDHCQAGAHVAGEVEGGDAGTKRECRQGVAEIVDPPDRVDPSVRGVGFQSRWWGSWSDDKRASRLNG